jgi:hypothetical protein
VVNSPPLQSATRFGEFQISTLAKVLTFLSSPSTVPDAVGKHTERIAVSRYSTRRCATAQCASTSVRQEWENYSGVELASY